MGGRGVILKAYIRKIWGIFLQKNEFFTCFPQSLGLFQLSFYKVRTQNEGGGFFWPFRMGAYKGGGPKTGYVLRTYFMDDPLSEAKLIFQKFRFNFRYECIYRHTTIPNIRAFCQVKGYILSYFH